MTRSMVAPIPFFLYLSVTFALSFVFGVCNLVFVEANLSQPSGRNFPFGNSRTGGANPLFLFSPDDNDDDDIGSELKQLSSSGTPVHLNPRISLLNEACNASASAATGVRTRILAWDMSAMAACDSEMPSALGLGRSSLLLLLLSLKEEDSSRSTTSTSCHSPSPSPLTSTQVSILAPARSSVLRLISTQTTSSSSELLLLLKVLFLFDA
mmetsp:Transcript_14852/g.22503  ORF Transcript_14852/g.22503 Transcript_14852/m.22503 type:complete len:210 (+) Transcript_14852:2453-3082(+)